MKEKGTREGRELWCLLVQVYRKKWVVYIDRLQREKANGASVSVGIHPSKVGWIGC